MQRETHLGYINEYMYSDVHSWRVSKRGDKFYATAVEKVPAVKPEWVPGGFSAICLNNDQIWSGDQTHDVGESFEIECRDGVYGYIDHVKQFVVGGTTIERLQSIVDRLNSERKDPTKEVFGVEQYQVFRYPLTSKGNKRRKFRKLGSGRLVDKCNYYYDYNF